MKPTRNFWPMGLILTFAIFISGTVGLVVMACSQKTDLVSADYYEREIRFQSHIDSLGRGKQVKAEIRYAGERHCIRISIPQGRNGERLTGKVQLYRPSAAGWDGERELEVDPEGVQSIDTAGLRPGLWKVRVGWTAGGQE